MRDQLFALQMPQRVLQLHQLDEQVMLGVQARNRHRRFEIEAEPLLNADSLQLRATLCEIEEQDQVENDRCGKNRVTTEKIHLDLHRVAEPSEDVDVIPSLFVVAARRIIVDADLVKHVSV